MRKILSLVLVLALVLGAFPAFADNGMSELEIANMLKEYKVLVGNENGDLMLDEYLTREQAVVILARLMNAEEEAMNTKLQSSFTDVDHPYYEPFIAYAELKGWTNGIGNGLFGFGQKLTVQQNAAYMLRALGYDTPYEGVMDTARTLGLLEGVMSDDPAAMILRGQTAVMMYNTLQTKPNNSDMTLMQQLGIEAPATGVAAIQKVEAKNLKQLKVYFTAPIEKAGDEDNWSVNKKASFEITKDASFELSEDKKMVTITLADGEVAEQQEVVTLTCKDLLDEEVVVEDIQFLDVTIPTVEKVEVVGINTVKVTFSEPMSYGGTEKGSDSGHSMLNKDNYKVKEADGSKLYINEVKSSKHNTVAFVELYSDLKQGDIVFEVKNIEDFQDYNVQEPAIFNLTVVKDTEKPYVVGYKDASAYEITLIWNEDIKFESDPDAESITDADELEKFYHTNSKDTPEKVTIDGNEMTLEFGYDEDADYDHLLPQGTAYVYVQDEAVEDYWENENDDQMLVAEIDLDKEAPSIVSHKQKTQRKLEVKFSENIYNKDDYEITLVKDGKKSKTGFTYEYKESGADYDKTLVFMFNKDMTGDYSLVFEKVEDRAGNVMPKTTYDVTFEDKLRPVGADFEVTAYNVGEKKQKILINFKEKMDVDSITDVDNYFLTVDSANSDGTSSYSLVADFDDDDVDFEVLDEGEKLLITLPEDVYDLTATPATALILDQYLKIGQVKDAAGNKMTTYSINKEIDNGDNTDIGSKAKLTGRKTIVVTIKDDVRAKLDIDQIQVGTTSGGAFTAFEPAKTNVKLNDDDETVITFTLKEKRDTTSNTGLAYKIDGTGIENKYGQEVADVTNGFVADKAAPEVLTVEYEKAAAGSDVSYLYVEFTEAINSDSIAVRGNNGFMDNEELISLNENNTVTLVPGMPNWVKIEEKDDDADFDEFTDLTYDGKNDIQDAAGNRVDDFDYTKKLELH